MKLRRTRRNLEQRLTPSDCSLEAISVYRGPSPEPSLPFRLWLHGITTPHCIGGAHPTCAGPSQIREINTWSQLLFDSSWSNIACLKHLEAPSSSTAVQTESKANTLALAKIISWPITTSPHSYYAIRNWYLWMDLRSVRFRDPRCRRARRATTRPCQHGVRSPV